MAELAQLLLQTVLPPAEQLNQLPQLVQVAPQKLTTAARKKVNKRALAKNLLPLQRTAHRRGNRLQRVVQEVQGAQGRMTGAARKKIEKMGAQAKIDVLLMEANATLEELDEVAQESKTTAKKIKKRKRRKVQKTTPAPPKLGDEEITANENVA